MSSSPEEILKGFTLYQINAMHKELTDYRSDFVKEVAFGTRVANHGDGDAWVNYNNS